MKKLLCVLLLFVVSQTYGSGVHKKAVLKITADKPISESILKGITIDIYRSPNKQETASLETNTEIDLSKGGQLEGITINLPDLKNENLKELKNNKARLNFKFPEKFLYKFSFTLKYGGQHDTIFDERESSEILEIGTPIVWNDEGLPNPVENIKLFSREYAK